VDLVKRHPAPDFKRQTKSYRRKIANTDAVYTIMMQAKSGAQIQAAQDETQELLRQRHHLQSSEDNDFSIRNLEELFAAQEASSSIMAIMLAAVASVSLVVGGIAS
jgi:putative ABC transport system permease protein